MKTKLTDMLAALRSQMPHFRLWPSVAALSAVALIMITTIVGNLIASSRMRDFSGIEPGRVAERDIIAEYSVSYVDEQATRLRVAARVALVPAVFRANEAVTRECLDSFSKFSRLANRLFGDQGSAESFWLAMQAQFPGAFPRSSIDALFRSPSRVRLLDSTERLLRALLDQGVYVMPESGLGAYNPDAVQLERRIPGRPQTEQVPLVNLITLKNLSVRIAGIVSDGTYPSAFRALAYDLAKPFVSENVFFSEEDTNRLVDSARENVEPVLKQIERGDRVLRKGSIVTREDMVRIAALNQMRGRIDPESALGRTVLLVFVFLLILFFSSQRVIGRRLTEAETYLIIILFASYQLIAAFASTIDWTPEYFPTAILLPTAFFTMIPALLMGPRVAAAMACALPLSAFVSGFFEMNAFLFALFSGVIGAFTTQVTNRRMDLIRSSALIALSSLVVCIALLLLYRAPLGAYPAAVFWAAFNGFVSGLIVLGSLPMFEHVMNTATTFRLIELSDLNSPILKRLLTVAPGTYSHSVMVANLAESACREIGADSLLARVGAYYHDIGKMDQPDYFIENQAAYNKHDEIAPRLSATVIRSHVKVGVEKARALGLPREVVDIIAEHHGNSVISWFYHEALKREEQVTAEDFSYPGDPPRSRESAVIMLADTVEAALRALKKPTLSRIEKFIQELIMSKFEQGQLANSELTFRDLENIRKAFSRVLAGHYHSRIEYPKFKEAVR